MKSPIFKEKRMLKTNYHTHGIWCDGKDGPEEMVLAAIEKKFDILGFSSHSMYPFASGWHMNVKDHDKYFKEISGLKEKYSDRIKILAGLEADYIPLVTAPDFTRFENFTPDFLIGSVHYIGGSRYIFEVDGSEDSVRKGINDNFSSTREAVCEYFCMEKEMLEKSSFTFLGHPDLIRKQNSTLCREKLFDENESWYKHEIKNLAKKIASSGVCVEVNTGAMARGYFNSPYPSPELLELLHSYNVPVTINSDCHDKNKLDFAFDEIVGYIKKAGYKEVHYFIDGKFLSQIV